MGNEKSKSGIRKSAKGMAEKEKLQKIEPEGFNEEQMWKKARSFSDVATVESKILNLLQENVKVQVSYIPFVSNVIATKFLQKTGKLPCGSIHLLGSLQLDWGEDSLVHQYEIKETKNNAVSLVITLKEIKKSDLRGDMQKIAQLIVDYNAIKTYSVVDCNCQHFVFDLLKLLDISSNIVTALAPFAKELTPTESQSFKFTFPNEKESTVFSNHTEFDEACVKRYEEKFEDLDEKDQILIKGIDRTFWIRECSAAAYEGRSNKETMENLDSKFHTCMFGNPLRSTWVEVIEEDT